MTQERPSHISHELFLEWRDARRGASNPEKQTNPWWTWVMQQELSGWGANNVFGGPSSFGGNPAWCFERFGTSQTMLPDGRVVSIAGEHEDYYDPDFYIYNDLIVTLPDGHVEMYGYPKEIFAPTDFHSATLVDKHIVVIGNVGYADERRVGYTPVVRFDLDSWWCKTIEAHGEGPGWISKHRAALCDDGNSLLVTGGQVYRDGADGFVENNHDWKLDCATWRWSLVTRRCWQQIRFSREDGKSNHLFEIGMTRSKKEHGWGDAEQDEKDLTEKLGIPPNYELHEVLFHPDIADEVVESDDEDEFGVFRIRKDGVIVRYVRDSWDIKMVVEGELSTSIITALRDDLQHKLECIENHPWTYQETTLE